MSESQRAKRAFIRAATRIITGRSLGSQPPVIYIQNLFRPRARLYGLVLWKSLSFVVERKRSSLTQSSGEGRLGEKSVRSLDFHFEKGRKTIHKSVTILGLDKSHKNFSIKVLTNQDEHHHGTRSIS